MRINSERMARSATWDEGACGGAQVWEVMQGVRERKRVHGGVGGPGSQATTVGGRGRRQDV